MSASGSPNTGRASPERHTVVLCQVGSIVCALPLEHVSETLRPLAVEALADTAPFIDGISIIRGKPVPVVDLARLLGSEASEQRTRLLLIKVGERSAALSVARVIGVRTLEPALVTALPPLMAGASAEVVSGVGSLDERLLLVLETSRIVPASSWASLEGLEA